MRRHRHKDPDSKIEAGPSSIMINGVGFVGPQVAMCFGANRSQSYSERHTSYRLSPLIEAGQDYRRSAQ